MALFTSIPPLRFGHAYSRDYAMMRRHFLIPWVILALAVCSPACGTGEEDSEPAQVPSLLRTRFTSEMKIILRDIQTSEETARAITGSYVDWDELRRTYLSRLLPDSYEIKLTEVSANSYRAEIVHRHTGLTCGITATAGGTGNVSTCR